MEEFSLDDLVGKVFVTKHESQEQPSQQGYWGYRLQVKNFIIGGAVSRQRMDGSYELSMIYTWNANTPQMVLKGGKVMRNRCTDDVLRCMANHSANNVAQHMGLPYIGIEGVDFVLNNETIAE